MIVQRGVQTKGSHPKNLFSFFAVVKYGRISMSPRWVSQAAEICTLSLELALPSTCRLCDACVPAGHDFCPGCMTQLSASEGWMKTACRRCGRPGAAAGLSGVTSTGSEVGGCTFCKKEKLAFQQTIALWTYDGLVRQAVVAAKYGGAIALADALGIRLAERLITAFGGCDGAPDLITCVPAHFLRRIERGAGGSRLIADAVARRVKVDWPDCRRVPLLSANRRIAKQAWLGEDQRKQNVQGAFRISQRSAFMQVSGRLFRGLQPVDLCDKHVLLIDDVMTTGATSSEIASVLLAAGAAKVTVAVVARAFSG